MQDPLRGLLVRTLPIELTRYLPDSAGRWRRGSRETFESHATGLSFAVGGVPPQIIGRRSASGRQLLTSAEEDEARQAAETRALGETKKLQALAAELQRIRNQARRLWECWFTDARRRNIPCPLPSRGESWKMNECSFTICLRDGPGARWCRSARRRNRQLNKREVDPCKKTSAG